MSRTEFSKKTKAEAFVRCRGFCEGTRDGKPCGIKLTTGKFRYDHRNPDWMGGDNSLENCQVLGMCCDDVKTPQDQKAIAKVKRIRQKHQGIKSPRTITRWRRFDGTVVVKKRER